MKKFEDEIKKMFKEEQIPEISQDKRNELKSLVRQNKQPSKKVFIKPVFATLCCILIFVGILIPIINHLNNDDTIPNNTFYTDNTATRINLEEDFVTTFISNNYSKYNTMFEKCKFSKSYGYYTPDSSKLLAINITLQEISFPKTTVVVFLVVDNQFVYEQKNNYMSNSEVINTDSYTLYKKTESSPINEYMSGYFNYNNYDLYLNLNMINNGLFDIFL